MLEGKSTGLTQTHYHREVRLGGVWRQVAGVLHVLAGKSTGLTQTLSSGSAAGLGEGWRQVA
jgi:hypothetical protein